MICPGFKERFIQLTKQPYGWATKHNVSPGTITSILENRRPQQKTIRKIVELTGCSEAWLVHGIGEMYPDKHGEPALCEPTDADTQVPGASPESGREARSPHEAGVSEGPPKAAPRREALIGVIIGVETFLEEDGLVMTAEKKAELIVAIYELYLGGSELTPELFQTFVRLAA